MWSSQASGEAAVIAICFGDAPWTRWRRAQRRPSKISCRGLAQENTLTAGCCGVLLSTAIPVDESQSGTCLASAIHATWVFWTTADNRGRHIGDISVRP